MAEFVPRAEGLPRQRVLVLDAELDNLDQVRRFVRQTANALGGAGAAVSDLALAVDEAVTNTVMHGYRGGGGRIEVSLEQQGDALLARVRDNARAFDPAAEPAPDLSRSPLERVAPGGYGVHLIKHMVDEVHHRVMEDGRNELTLVKLRAVRRV